LIFETGLDLGRTWLVMHGAVGLWLWGKPAELRASSVTVWQSEDHMRRFVRWPVHAEIVRAWRGRATLASDLWAVKRFSAEQVWDRAQKMISSPHPASRVHASAERRT
ncbi:MAG: hypothetical protein ACRDNS_07480, partial [Trebonia sp.]